MAARHVTDAGLRIDSNCHVLDDSARPIVGMFAAGEYRAGVLGERYASGGNGS